MKRILTGIQSTGSPHLGNLLGAMLPAIELAQDAGHEALFFIADLHTLTTNQDPIERKNYVHTTAAAWLACGLDPEKVIFYRQSQIPAVCELAWYLSCFAPYPMLANAHAFKEKTGRLAKVSAGLFTYPVLMAADILLYAADVVPVGQDQLQHLEIARDIATNFNRRYGTVLIVPQARVQTGVRTVLGTDGQKMSKSYGNVIDPFLPEKDLKKAVMAIVTDSTPLDRPKNPDQCTVFNLYSMLASADQSIALRQRYQAGGYGYGQAKKALWEMILDRFAAERSLFRVYMRDESLVEKQLTDGESKARRIAEQTLELVRNCLGYRTIAK